MKKLLLIRHGESAWNKENRFTGWTDVPLSEQGVAEAKKAGKVLKDEGFHFKVANTMDSFGRDGSDVDSRN